MDSKEHKQKKKRVDSETPYFVPEIPEVFPEEDIASSESAMSALSNTAVPNTVDTPFESGIFPLPDDISDDEIQNILEDDGYIAPSSPYLSKIPEKFRKTTVSDQVDSSGAATANQQAGGSGWTVGKVINDKYQIIKVIGRGGMGKVFKVRHLRWAEEKFFALKLLHPHFSQDPKFRKRFAREVEAATKFVHENAIQIRDFGETADGCQYFTMDFSEGKPLTELIFFKRINLETALDITRQILKVLAKMHERGVVHRDLKPGNIIVENRGKPHALLLDFGIAKIIDREATNTTERGDALGTPQYMSPEQIKCRKTDARSDLYSMGVILYQMLTGETPFTGKTSEILIAHLTKNPSPPSKVTPALPPAVEKLIMKAMAKDPRQRFTSANEFIQAIDSLHLRRPRRYSFAKKSFIAFFIGMLLSAAFYGGHLYLRNEKLQNQFEEAVDKRDLAQAKDCLRQIDPILVGREQWRQLRNRLDTLIREQQQQQQVQQHQRREMDALFDTFVQSQDQLETGKNFLQRYPNSPRSEAVRAVISTLIEIYRGFAAYDKKKYALAISNLTPILGQQRPQLLSPYIWEKALRCLGQSYYHSQQWQMARHTLSKVESQPMAKIYLGFTCYRLKQDREALQFLAQPPKNLKPAMQKRIVRAKIAMLRRNKPVQEEHLWQALREAIAIAPRSSYYKQLGQLAAKRGDTEQAVEYWQKYLAIATKKDPQVIEQLRRLQQKE